MTLFSPLPEDYFGPNLHLEERWAHAAWHLQFFCKSPRSYRSLSSLFHVTLFSFAHLFMPLNVRWLKPTDRLVKTENVSSQIRPLEPLV